MLVLVRNVNWDVFVFIKIVQHFSILLLILWASESVDAAAELWIICITSSYLILGIKYLCILTWIITSFVYWNLAFGRAVWAKYWVYFTLWFWRCLFNHWNCWLVMNMMILVTGIFCYKLFVSHKLYIFELTLIVNWLSFHCKLILIIICIFAFLNRIGRALQWKICMSSCSSNNRYGLLPYFSSWSCFSKSFLIFKIQHIKLLFVGTLLLYVFSIRQFIIFYEIFLIADQTSLFWRARRKLLKIKSWRMVRGLLKRWFHWWSKPAAWWAWHSLTLKLLMFVN